MRQTHTKHNLKLQSLFEETFCGFVLLITQVTLMLQNATGF